MGGMTSRSPASARPRSRTIDGAGQPSGGSRPASSPRGVYIPESWLRGILAGAEGVLGTWLLIVVPAIAAYIATAAAPELGTASWMEAGQIGTGVWLAAHGAQLDLGDVTFTLLPLGVSLLAFGLTAAAIRRAALSSWAGLGFAVLTYLLGAVLLAQLVPLPGNYRAIGGAAIIAIVATAWGMRRAYPPSPVWMRARAEAARTRLHNWIAGHPQGARLQRVLTRGGIALRAGARTALWVVAGVLVLGAAGVLASTIAAFPLVAGVHGRLEVDVVSGVVLTASQLLMLPTFAVWGAAYLSGAGFTLGQGTLYSPGEVLSAPLPAIPALGALPNPEATIAHTPVWGYMFLIVGLLAGWYLHRRIARLSNGPAPLTTALAGAAATTAIVVIAVLVLATLSSGGFGPGRFAADVGPRVGPFAGAVAWQVAAPMSAVIIAASATVHGWVRRGWEKITG